MKIDNIENFLKNFRWNTLQKMYGCAHNSIIGFISSEWINQSESNSVLDGAPSPKIGRGRTGQRNADILLCKEDKPFVVVEVESGVSKYSAKIDTMWGYLTNKKDFNGIELALLVMTNSYGQTGKMAYKHNWDTVKEKVRRGKYNIALVSLEKSKARLDDSMLGHLRNRNFYYSRDITAINYRIFDGENEKEGNLWKQ